jgi:hypothetical protein
MSIHSWSRSAYSYHHNTTLPAALSTSFQAFPVTVDLANNSGSERFPDTCNIQSVEFDFVNKQSVSTVTMYIARDSNGSSAVTPGSNSGSTASITAGAGTTASAVFGVDTDYHFDPSVSNTTTGTVYVMAKVDDASSNPTANIRINWRG